MTLFTQDEIIEMARQAGFFVWTDEQKTIEGYGEDLERFSKLVADVATAKEREACAKICDTTPPEPFRPSIEAAYAIRARGAKE